MPVVVHDSDAPKSQRKAFVGTDNVAAGKLAGQAAIDALKAANITKGKVAMFVGRIDMQNSIDRKRGIDETLGKQPGIEILPIFLDGADRNKAKKNVEDALARYPDLVMMIGLWSYNGPAMVDAVQASTRKKKPVVVAFDEEEETLKAVEDGTIFATIVQRPFQFGYQSMKALKDVRDGKTIPTFIDTTIQKIDKSNLATVLDRARDEIKKDRSRGRERALLARAHRGRRLQVPSIDGMRAFKKELTMLGVMIALAIITAVLNPLFLGGDNLRNNIRHISLISLFALGEAMVIIAGGIDLSIGSIICVTGGHHQLPGDVRRLRHRRRGGDRVRDRAGRAACSQGGIVARLGIPPFVVTLGFDAASARRRRGADRRHRRRLPGPNTRASARWARGPRWGCRCRSGSRPGRSSWSPSSCTARCSAAIATRSAPTRRRRGCRACRS